MESRDIFLKSKLPKGENRYDGYIHFRIPQFNGDIDHTNIYKDFVKQFSPAIYTDKRIIKELTKKKIVIKSGTLYVFYIRGFNRERTNSVKLHATQNFIVNWDEYNSYIRRIDPLSYNHLTVNTVTAEEIFDTEYHRGLLGKEDILSDIQFISMNYKEKAYMKYYFHESIKKHIAERSTRGLITIILFNGFDSQFIELGYEDRLCNLVDFCKVNFSNATNNDSIDVLPQGDLEGIDTLPMTDSFSLDHKIKEFNSVPNTMVSIHKATNNGFANDAFNN